VLEFIGPAHKTPTAAHKRLFVLNRRKVSLSNMSTAHSEREIRAYRIDCLREFYVTLSSERSALYKRIGKRDGNVTWIIGST